MHGALSTKDLTTAVLAMWPDADLGGDLSTTKSTSGLWLELSSADGLRTWPLGWFSTKQATTSGSTCEAETSTVITAMNTGLRKIVVPMLHLLETVLRRSVKLVCHEDNTQAIIALQKGYPPSLRHLARHNRLSLGFVHEVFHGRNEDGTKMYDAEVRHAPSATQKGDIMFTTALDRAAFEAAKMKIGIFKKVLKEIKRSKRINSSWRYVDFVCSAVCLLSVCGVFRRLLFAVEKLQKRRDIPDQADIAFIAFPPSILKWQPAPPYIKKMTYTSPVSQQGGVWLLHVIAAFTQTLCTD
ncbi:unnamed protein product [Polarella glacialis]|uniref:Uncharacterized protein n=1 Tax=Polarella glacialis TaxID=89957 RepID=A0A813GWK3_POLGL|nr:unnamed protein product [Polarella glacialis]